MLQREIYLADRNAPASYSYVTPSVYQRYRNEARKTAGARRAAIFFNFAAAVLRNRATAGVSELRETLVASSTPPINARDRHAFKFYATVVIFTAARRNVAA